MFPLNGFTHIFKADLDTLIIATNCLNGFPLNAYYVFEIPSNNTCIGLLQPHGPYTTQNEAVATAMGLVAEIDRFVRTLAPEPGAEL